MTTYPGEAVDSAGRSIVSAIDGVGSSVVRGVENAGSSIQDAVDKPFQSLGLRASPLRIVDAPIKGLVRGGSNFVSSGVIGSLETVGKGITSGLDEVPKTIVGSKGIKAPKGLNLPKMGR